MKTPLPIAPLNRRILTLFLVLVVALASATVSQAMSELVSLSIEPEWPATSNPGNVTLYKVTVTRVGQGVLDVSLAVGDLPGGAIAAFAADSLRFTGRSPETLTTTLAITCTNPTPTDACPFTVIGASRRESTTVTNQSLPVLASLRLAGNGPVLALDRLVDGSIKIRGKGITGATYGIEVTPDLARPSWVPVQSSTADGNGRFILIDAQLGHSGVRFYRAVTLAP